MLSQIIKFLRRKWWLVIIFIIVVSALAGVLVIRHQNQVAFAKKQAAIAEQQYKSNLSKIEMLNNQYFDVFRQYVSLPSSTTKKSAEWDSYYDGLISQLKSTQALISNISFANDRLSSVLSQVNTACSDLSNELSLAKSSTDMQFQVDTDKSKLSTDQSTLSGEQNIYDSDPLIGDSYVVEFQTDVKNDNNQLASDQQTYQTQQQQITTLSDTVLQESVSLTKATSALGL